MMEQTREPETLVANQAKRMLGEKPKATTKYCNPSGSLKSHMLATVSFWKKILIHRLRRISYTLIEKKKLP
jgi:hypothetical protein